MRSTYTKTKQKTQMRISSLLSLASLLIVARAIETAKLRRLMSDSRFVGLVS